MHQEIAPTLPACNCGKYAWQPIETAPKLGQQVLCAHKDKKWVRFGRVPIGHGGRWYYSGTSERSQFGQIPDDAPTHWMPLPEPPA